MLAPLLSSPVPLPLRQFSHTRACAAALSKLMAPSTLVREIPRPLETYPSAADQSLAAELSARIQLEPFNALATGVFLVAVLHTFAAARFATLAHRIQHRHDARAQSDGRPRSPSVDCRTAALFRRGRGGVRVVGRRPARCDDRVRGLGHRRRTTSTTPSTTPSRCSSSSSWRWRRRAR